LSASLPCLSAAITLPCCFVSSMLDSCTAQGGGRADIPALYMSGRKTADFEEEPLHDAAVHFNICATGIKRLLLRNAAPPPQGSTVAAACPAQDSTDAHPQQVLRTAMHMATCTADNTCPEPHHASNLKSLNQNPCSLLHGSVPCPPLSCTTASQ
jgi:hypothetical protein